MPGLAWAGDRSQPRRLVDQCDAPLPQPVQDRSELAVELVGGRHLGQVRKEPLGPFTQAGEPTHRLSSNQSTPANAVSSAGAEVIAEASTSSGTGWWAPASSRARAVARGGKPGEQVGGLPDGHHPGGAGPRPSEAACRSSERRTSFTAASKAVPWPALAASRLTLRANNVSGTSRPNSAAARTRAAANSPAAGSSWARSAWPGPIRHPNVRDTPSPGSSPSRPGGSKHYAIPD